MAGKKAGVQALQQEVNTDDEFEQFLSKDQGLLVMDVYTEWCGPCVGCVPSLKKIKLELGGDNLILAVVKSDRIKALERFRDKSEPTWLFASHGKIINLMFGTNVPKLMRMITEELELEAKYVAGEAERKFYDINELLPEEIERLEAKAAEEEKIRKVELEAEAKKRKAYIEHVTNEIKTHLTDIGCTVFMPNVNRDIYKKLGDPAEKFELTAKERKITPITKDNLEVLHLDCPNQLPEEVLNYIQKKDVIINAWKLAEGDLREPEAVLADFAKYLTTPTAILDDQGNPTGNEIPQLITDWEVPGTSLKICGVWTPMNRTTNAALIYLFFRPFTEYFLPPDPEPVPPHLCVIYDAYKKKEIMELCEQYPKDVLAYGYFSSQDPNTAELLAKKMDKYNERRPQPSDKLIIKLAKKDSNTVLAFSALGPCYISQNCVEGEEECTKFFPKGYGDDEKEGEGGKKKRRKRKSRKSDASADGQAPREGEGEGDVTIPEEGEEESSSSASPEKQSNNEEKPATEEKPEEK